MTKINSVKSVIRVGEQFREPSAVKGSEIDPRYVEGAIIWIVDGHPFLDEKQWDLIDQLWAYLIYGVDQAFENGKHDGYFPDQPLRLSFETVSEHDLRVIVGDRAVVINKSVCVDVLAAGGREFFQEMFRLVPEARDSWELQLSEIARLESRVARS